MKLLLCKIWQVLVTIRLVSNFLFSAEAEQNKVCLYTAKLEIAMH